MLTIENIFIPEGLRKKYPTNYICLSSHFHGTIDGTGLTLLPALIDPHVHFRTPGAEHKENWISGSRAALAGGVTCVFDMPNNFPSCSSAERLRLKKERIDQLLNEAGIPLRYYLYFGASKTNLSEIPQLKNEAIGIKVFMGSSTGDLLIDDEASLKEVFQRAAEANLIVVLHAEDEAIIRKNQQLYSHRQDPAVHSLIRGREAAIRAVEKAIRLAEPYGTRLSILHVSTKEEVNLIREAKQRNQSVYAEVSPHHLFLSNQAYEHLGSCALVNPPLREEEDCNALWEALRDGTFDYIGSDHAPHLLAEKKQPYGKAPSGFPGIEVMLPLFLTAVAEGKLTLDRLIEMTRTRIETIFQLPPQDDFILVNLQQERTVQAEQMNSRSGWSPYEGWELRGWPEYACLKGHLFKTNRLVPCHQI